MWFVSVFQVVSINLFFSCKHFKIRSKDGSVLCVSSTDGYCSFITFDEKELGIPYVEAVDPTKAHLPLAGEESSSNHKTEQKVDATVNITTHVTLSNAEESPSLQRYELSNIWRLLMNIFLMYINVSFHSKPQKKRVSLVTLFSPKQKLSPLNTGKNVSGNVIL